VKKISGWVNPPGMITFIDPTPFATPVRKR
jgi:hypothetical protein